jgi:hypothetical protein
MLEGSPDRRTTSLRLGEQQIALNQGRLLRLKWEEFCGLYLLLTLFVCALDLPSKHGDKRSLADEQGDAKHEDSWGFIKI